MRACVLLIHFMTAAAMHLTSLAHSPTSGILLPELLVGEGLSSADGRGTSSSIGVAIVNGRFPVSKPTPLYSHVAAATEFDFLDSIDGPPVGTIAHHVRCALDSVASLRGRAWWTAAAIGTV